MYKKFIILIITLIAFSNVSAKECLLTSDGDYLSEAGFKGFNTPTYVNENSDVFVQIGDLIVELDGYAQTTIPCNFSKPKNSPAEHDNEVDIISVSSIKKMPECLLINDNGEQVNVIQSSKNALLFADNYYVYSDELQEGIYVFRSADGFLASDKGITIEDQCVIYPIS